MMTDTSGTVFKV